MKKLLLISINIIIGVSAYAQLIDHPDNLILIDGFLYGNKIENSVKNKENNIYKPESIFTFNYRFIDKNGKELFFIVKEKGTWFFTSNNEMKDGVVKNFQLKILNENMNFNNPSYYQTGISYIIDREKANYGITGLIENEKNVWLHPPREFLFEILELNPFPYIKYPLEIGHSWDWKLKIGSAWGDKRWKVWSGNIENQYHYKIVGKETINTNIGPLECFVIESKAESKLGVTKLTSFFNERFGFVKLQYTNIDKSKLDINIQEVRKQMVDILKNSL